MLNKWNNDCILFMVYCAPKNDCLLLFPAPFFLAFLIAELLVGIPITCMELSLGQFAGRDFISVWTMCPAAKGKVILRAYHLQLCSDP